MDTEQEKVFTVEKDITEPEKKWQLIRRGIGYGLIISRDFFYEAKGFDEALDIAEDTDFLIRLASLSPQQKIVPEIVSAVVNTSFESETLRNKQVRKRDILKMLMDNNKEHIDKALAKRINTWRKLLR